MKKNFRMCVCVCVCAYKIQRLKKEGRDFPGDPVAKSCAPNAGSLCLILGRRTQSQVLQLRPSTDK